MPTATTLVTSSLTIDNFRQYGAAAYGIEIYGTTCTLTYEGNGATSGTPPTKYTYVPNTMVTVSNAGSLARINHTFAGWNTEADGSGIPYSTGDTFRIMEDTKLYAQWTPDSYTVSGTLSGGSVGGLTVSYTINGGSLQTVTTDASGNYTITDVPHGSDVFITPPTQSGYMVSPASRTINNISADSTGNDFSYTLINVTVSKTITGAYADYTKEFTFTIYFTDGAENPLSSGTQFAYTGGVISGSGATAPANSTLELQVGGKATFTLKHGQTITIAGVAASGKVRIVETVDSNYTTSFKDSEEAASINGNDTSLRGMTPSDRTFDFVNIRAAVVPTGIAADSGGMVLLVLLAMLALSVSLMITVVRRRTRAC